MFIRVSSTFSILGLLPTATSNDLLKIKEVSLVSLFHGGEYKSFPLQPLCGIKTASLRASERAVPFQSFLEMYPRPIDRLDLILRCHDHK